VGALNIVDRINENKDLVHCWQHQKRLDNLEADLLADGLMPEEVATLRTSNFTFRPIDYKNKLEKIKVDEFIKRHEWLERMPQRTTHVFGAFFEEILVGITVFATPNAFSNALGSGTKNIEKLLSRGAVKSWTPKNTASWLVMKSINWMVANTEFRLFSAYSDPEAKELGTIYQACGWKYLGQSAGGSIQCFDPKNPQKGWFSDREIRKTSTQKRLLREAGFSIQKEWLVKGEFKTSNLPEDTKQLLRELQKEYSVKLLKRYPPKKHKYCIVLGRSKKETKRLNEQLRQNVKMLPYPKQR
jgi:hypothetical protein